MAKQTVNNGDTMLQARTKINSNFDELYAQSDFITSVSADTTLDATHETVSVDATAGNKTITLPTAVGADGQMYNIRKSDSSANTVIIDGDGSETINGATTLTIRYQYNCVTIQSDGANWIII